MFPRNREIDFDFVFVFVSFVRAGEAKLREGAREGWFFIAGGRFGKMCSGSCSGRVLLCFVARGVVFRHLEPPEAVFSSVLCLCEGAWLCCVLGLLKNSVFLEAFVLNADFANMQLCFACCLSP